MVATRTLLKLDILYLDIPRESGVTWKAYQCAWCEWYVVCEPCIINPIGEVLQHLSAEHGIEL